MRPMTLYVARNSLIHQVDPISKLLYILSSLLVPLLVGNIFSALLCLGFSLSILWLAGVLSKSWPMMGIVLSILITVVIIQGLFYPSNQTKAFPIGAWFFYEEGLHYATVLSLRVLNIMAAFLILILTTKPSDLIDALQEKGLSPQLGYVLSSVFHILPEMISTMRRIGDAQRSRGLETEGGLGQRIKAFIPLIGPVILRSLLQTKERALALELRGFQGSQNRVTLFEPRTYFYPRWIQFALIGAILISMGWRWLT